MLRNERFLIKHIADSDTFLYLCSDLIFNSLKHLIFMTKFLIVKLTAKNGNKPLFERQITLNSVSDLSEFPFASVIDALDFLFPLEHDIEFIIQHVA